MDKAVQWGHATSPSAQQDISEHMQSLGIFLQQLVHTLQTMVISNVRPLCSKEEVLPCEITRKVQVWISTFLSLIDLEFCVLDSNLNKFSM